jgi:hypothetical protein
VLAREARAGSRHEAGFELPLGFYRLPHAGSQNTDPGSGDTRARACLPASLTRTTGGGSSRRADEQGDRARDPRSFRAQAIAMQGLRMSV